MVPMEQDDWKEALGVTSIHDLPDELLRLILLRLDSPLYLIRAAGACKRWRHAVTDNDDSRAFLRLARSLHPPTVIGHFRNYSGDGGYRFMPSSSAINGGITVDDDFHDTYSSVADCHGGLILLHVRCVPGALANLIIYDPLTRKQRYKYRWIKSRPRLPTEHYYSRYDDITKDTFLLDGDDGSISMSNFRVLYWHNTAAAATEPQACVFSTANGGEWNWLFSPDASGMEKRVLPKQNRNIFKYTLPWPQSLRACC